MKADYVTPKPWLPSLQHSIYADRITYEMAASWLGDCQTVADWGGSTGFFGTCLPAHVRYHVVDGTRHPGAAHILADLADYHEPSDGILLRHVLDATEDWEAVLANALDACRQRIVVVTFTPDVEETTVMKLKSGWPIRHFNPADIRLAMGAWYVTDEQVQTTHPERVFYGARP